MPKFSIYSPKIDVHCKLISLLVAGIIVRGNIQQTERLGPILGLLHKRTHCDQAAPDRESDFLSGLPPFLACPLLCGFTFSSIFQTVLKMVYVHSVSKFLGANVVP